MLLLVLGVPAVILIIVAVALAARNDDEHGHRGDDDGSSGGLQRLKNQLGLSYRINEVISQQVFADPTSATTAPTTTAQLAAVPLPANTIVPVGTTSNNLVLQGFYSVVDPLAEEERRLRVEKYRLRATTAAASGSTAVATTAEIESRNYSVSWKETTSTSKRGNHGFELRTEHDEEDSDDGGRRNKRRGDEQRRSNLVGCAKIRIPTRGVPSASFFTVTLSPRTPSLTFFSPTAAYTFDMEVHTCGSFFDQRGGKEIEHLARFITFGLNSSLAGLGSVAGVLSTATYTQSTLGVTSGVGGIVLPGSASA